MMDLETIVGLFATASAVVLGARCIMYMRRENDLKEHANIDGLTQVYTVSPKLNDF